MCLYYVVSIMLNMQKYFQNAEFSNGENVANYTKPQCVLLLHLERQEHKWSEGTALSSRTEVPPN